MPLKRCPACRQEYDDAAAFCSRDGAALGGRADAADELATTLPPEPVADPLVGTTVAGRFRVEQALGSGGMGRVYRVRHALIGKPFALKLLKDDLARDQEAVGRFLTEARAISRVAHENVVSVCDFGRLPDGRYYLVMEYCDGQSLAAFLRGVGEVPYARALPIVRQIAAALAAIHAHGIVHRDLKPANVMLADEGGRDAVKLLDFGLARLTDVTTRLTPAGARFGTPLYMAPEQVAGRETDPRTDLYALGALAYELLAGRPPFSAATLDELFRQHLEVEPAPPQGRHPVPFEVAALVLRWLAKDPRRRGVDLARCLDDIDAVQVALGLGGRRGRRSRFPDVAHDQTLSPAASDDTAALAVPAAPALLPGELRQRYQKVLLEIVRARWPDPALVVPPVRRLLLDLRAAEAELEERLTEQALLVDEIQEIVRNGQEREALVRAVLVDLGMERGGAATEELRHLDERIVDLERRIQEIQLDTRRTREQREAILRHRGGYAELLAARVDTLYASLADLVLDAGSGPLFDEARRLRARLT